MAFRRGRRFRPRVQWMPNPGTLRAFTGNATDVAIQWNGIEVSIAINPGDTNFPVLAEAPLVQDQPTKEQFQGTALDTYQKFGLNQTEEWGWRLRRVVGDLFVGYGALNGNDTIPYPAVLVEAGIIVRKVSEGGQPDASPNDSDPGNIGNNDDPWVWRRNWVLGIGTDRIATGLLGNSIDAALARFPSTNVDYGSAGTGARVDQKTARRIGPEERLFLDLNVTPLPLEAGSVYTQTETSLVYVNFDYRVLGTIYTSRGNRRNASR